MRTTRATPDGTHDSLKRTGQYSGHSFQALRRGASAPTIALPPSVLRIMLNWICALSPSPSALNNAASEYAPVNPVTDSRIPFLRAGPGIRARIHQWRELVWKGGDERSGEERRGEEHPSHMWCIGFGRVNDRLTVRRTR
jgi:hypothetical protein